jgi:hypothetical protein
MALLLKYARSILPALETEAFASLGGVCALGLGGFCGSRKHVRVTHDASTFWRYHVVCLRQFLRVAEETGVEIHYIHVSMQ